MTLIAASGKANSHVRFLIVAVLFAVTCVNYASRSSLSIAGAQLSDELSVSAVEMGHIFAGFAWSYVIGQLPGGALLDRFGSRAVYIWSIALWSLFTGAQALVGAPWFLPVITGLFLMRFLLGLAESPSFPANARIVANWFPNSERGTASAIFNSAQYFSLVAFAPLMGWLTQTYGWRTMFLVMGGIGLVAAAVFAGVIQPPTRHKRVSQAELDYITANGALVNLDQGGTDKPRSPIRWSVIGQLLGNRMLLGIYLAQYCITALTYFYATWFPIYLVKARGLSIMEAGFASVGPALCGWVGGILGGIFSDMLLRRGYSLSASRKIPIFTGLVISAAILGCNFTDSQTMVLLFMSVAFFGKGVAALGWAVLSDVAPKEATGLAGSIFNTFGNAAGIFTPIAIGYIFALTGSFDAALVFLCLHSVVALASFALVTGEIKRVVLK
jgi:ACS family glucarate transporter-like MFS transporter